MAADIGKILKNLFAFYDVSGKTIVSAGAGGGQFIEVAAEARALGLSDHIETINRDMNAMGFPPASFDVVWSEGALYQMGIANGLRACRPLLRPGGAIALTELVWFSERRSDRARKWAEEYADMKDIPENLALFADNGYAVIGCFPLPVSSWFDNYYDPMQIRVNELRGKTAGNAEAVKVLDMAQAEIDGFRIYSAELGYEFFVARRIP